MKSFLKHVFSTVVGIMVFMSISMFLAIIAITGMLASESKLPEVKSNSVMTIKLCGFIQERGTDNGLPFMKFMNQDMETQGLDQLTEAIEKAKDNEHIKGIYIEAGPASFDSPATMIALRRSLNAFKKSNKWVIAYSDQFTQGAYYVASVADELYLNATGSIDFRGLGSRTAYYKGLFDKIGVDYQAMRVGKYKSYVESMTRTDMSAEDREQRMTYLSGIWNMMLSDIAKSRHTTVEALNSFANDSILLLANQQDYLKMRLVDKLLYPEELKALVQKKMGVDQDDDITQITASDMAKTIVDQKERGDQVAVYYAVGGISDTDLSSLTGEHGIVGKTMARDLRELADDDDVKAVVIRVNSGGGSAVASEQIHHAVELLKQKKPVVVSMGGAAASGGYMLSCGASYIIAEPATITGSIGIFGMIPNVSRLLTDKLGVTYDEVGTNRFTNSMERLVTAKDNAQERMLMQTYINQGYDRFITMVSKGRKLSKERVHEIAQGRVWLGQDAVKLKLVDQLGTLDDAVKKAASLAQMDDYRRKDYPAAEDWMERLLKETIQTDDNYLNSQFRELLGSHYQEWVMIRTAEKRNRLQATLPYSIVVE